MIGQVLASLSVEGRDMASHFLRTSDQHELDLVLEAGGEIWAFEIKLTASTTLADMQRLNRVAGMIGARRQVLVSQTSKPTGDGARLSCNLEHLPEHITKW